jgi:hypothetical protein
MEAATLTFALAIALSGLSQTPGAIKDEEIKYQSQAFEAWWGADLEWRFDDLPTKGSVAVHRVPYSGHDYPDSMGGTVQTLYKYDRAFHGGRSLASAYEEQDVTAQQELTYERRGLLRLRRVPVHRTPHWHGHCNGWTAASIRHAEPQRSVTRNGVVFTPADIKALLADIYMYSDAEFLGGIDYAINPGTLHVIFANWLGRGHHPIGMETTLGDVVFNYPAYAYSTSSARHSDRRVEVRMHVAYAESTNHEYDQSPRENSIMRFHYLLHLDEEGNIVGGEYLSDSSRIDMLWTPLNPVQGGEEGNERGNPHIDVKEVLAMWRESVDEELRRKWYNIDPAEEDRILDGSEEQTAEGHSAEDEVARNDAETGTPETVVSDTAAAPREADSNDPNAPRVRLLHPHVDRDADSDDAPVDVEARPRRRHLRLRR